MHSIHFAALLALVARPLPPPPPIFSAREVAATGSGAPSKIVWEPAVAADANWALLVFNVDKRIGTPAPEPRTGYALFDRASGDWISEGQILPGTPPVTSVDASAACSSRARRLWGIPARQPAIRAV